MGTASPQKWDENGQFCPLTSPQKRDILIYHYPQRSAGLHPLRLCTAAAASRDAMTTSPKETIMTNEPNNAELIAATSGLILLMRQIIEKIDRDDPGHVDAALDAVHGHLAVCGGSMMVLADRLGLRSEVEATISQRMQRLANLQACGGLAGTA